MPDDDGKPFTPAALAARWGCSTTLVYKLLKEERSGLVGFRLGDLWRISALSVQQYECQTPTSPESPPALAQPRASTAPIASRNGPTANATAARLARLTR